MYHSFFLFLNMGGQETMLIVFVALLLFGGKKLPELARGLGKGIREFKDASEGVKREIHNSINNVTEHAGKEPSVKSAEFVETEPILKNEPAMENQILIEKKPFIGEPVIAENLKKEN